MVIKVTLIMPDSQANVLLKAFKLITELGILHQRVGTTKVKTGTFELNEIPSGLRKTWTHPVMGRLLKMLLGNGKELALHNFSV